MVQYIENNISITEYLDIREKVNWLRLSNRQAEMAISKSLFFVKAVDDSGELLGMGRVIGDGAVICYIQDMIVVPAAQRRGIGSGIMTRLINYVKSITEDGTEMKLCLMSAKGREVFYEQFGFMKRPTEALGCGMIQYIEK